MKKVFFAFAFLLVALPSSPQTKDFTSEPFDSCMALWNDLGNRYKDRGNIKWANAAAQVFPLNLDKEIEYKYVINAKEAFNMDDMLDILGNWINLEFTNARPLIDYINHTMQVEGLIRGIGQHSGFYSFTTINAAIKLRIELKENRIRISSRISHYNLGSAGLGSMESNTRLIGDCYPFDREGDHKRSYAMAFINGNSVAINKIHSLIEYLNTHSESIYNCTDDNW